MLNYLPSIKYPPPDLIFKISSLWAHPVFPATVLCSAPFTVKLLREVLNSHHLSPLSAIFFFPVQPVFFLLSSARCFVLASGLEFVWSPPHQLEVCVLDRAAPQSLPLPLALSSSRRWLLDLSRSWMTLVAISAGQFSVRIILSISAAFETGV